MPKIIILIKDELLIHHKINQTVKYLLLFLSCYVFCSILINEPSEIKNFGLSFLIIYYPLSLFNLSDIILKQDYNDGRLENLYSSYNISHIIIAKYSCLVLCALFALSFSLIPITLIFSLNLYQSIVLLALIALLQLLASALTLLSSTIECYFLSNNFLLTNILWPLLVPCIIIANLILKDSAQISLIYFIIGANLIIIPLSLLFSGYLAANIYNSD